MRVLVLALLAMVTIALPPLAGAKEPPSTAPCQSVADTHWRGNYSWSDGESREWTLWFRADGVLIYGYGGASYDNGRWGQRDALIWIDTNDHYAMYVGRCINGEVEGSSFNRVGLRGEWRVRPE